ncbi:MAG: ATP-dependent Clp protease proteolytic subunit [Prevotellaceae bacterium]|jgi:ATP-dependent Clp protease protease subunit|nr:ATP-dependent Clp protease proteolytic subunit [Prevotellaceae bacterium]
MHIKVYSDIASEDALFDFFGIRGKVFSAESVKDMLDDNPDEKELHFDINCNGGSTREGFAIYDLIRTSGRTIFCNIDGGCHSMATVLLLAAPKENRTANPNATAIIHDVRAYIGEVTADEAQTIADDLKNERDKILDIYADRTGYDRAELERLMLEERERTAKELLEWGFISKIKTYTTNKKMNGQNKKKSLKAKILEFLNSARGETYNYDFTDADGNVLFSTEKETDEIVVGDAATPDGTFELPDGRTVTIAAGSVTEIAEANPEVENLRNQIADLQAQLDEANNRNTEALNLLTEANTELDRLAQIRSKAEIPQRTGATGGKQNKTRTAEEIKAEAKAKLDKIKGGKK